MKTATLNTIKLQLALLFTFLLVFNFGCSKSEDDNQPPTDGEVINADGITEDDLDVYAGDLGLMVKTRNLSKKIM